MQHCYTIGCIATFALMGWWAGESSGTGREAAAVLGGVVGWAMGASFRPRTGSKAASRGGRVG